MFEWECIQALNLLEQSYPYAQPAVYTQSLSKDSDSPDVESATTSRLRRG